jgi:Na+-transporting NADH:ubiquinone oxidoreductase subunit NqrB
MPTSLHERLWVRDALTPQRVWLLLLLAVVPAWLWRCHAVGAERLAAMAANPDGVVDGWRQAVVALVAGSNRDSLWDGWWHGAAWLLPALVVALLVGLAGQWVLTRVSRVPLPAGSAWRMGWLALLFALLAPATAGLLWVAAGMLLVVAAEFVGRRSGNGWRLPPLVPALLLWHAALHGTGAVSIEPLAADAWTPVLALGGALAMAAGLLQWRRIAGVFVALALTAPIVNPFAVAPAGFGYAALLAGPTLLAVFFLLPDPVQAARTRLSQWLTGLVTGIAMVLLVALTPLGVDGVLLAVLAGSLLTVAIDRLYPRAG